MMQTTDNLPGDFRFFLWPYRKFAIEERLGAGSTSLSVLVSVVALKVRRARPGAGDRRVTQGGSPR